MRINLTNELGETVPVSLARADDQPSLWLSRAPEMLVSISIKDDGGIDEIQVGEGVVSTKDDIAVQFIALLAERLQQETAGIEFDEGDQGEDELPFPYDYSAN